MSMPDDKKEFTIELGVCTFVQWLSKKNKTSFNTALIQFMSTQLYKDMTSVESPLVACFPMGALKKMYKLEQEGKMEEYEDWRFSY
jgi:hypothetical protein